MPDIEGRIAALPIWSGPVALAPLSGGISNLSFTATDTSGKYVVRVTRDFPFHHVFRDREVMAARAAHAAGLAPEVVHAEPGLMVSRFIEGRVLTVARDHTDIPLPPLEYLLTSRLMPADYAPSLGGVGHLAPPATTSHPVAEEESVTLSMTPAAK